MSGTLSEWLSTQTKVDPDLRQIVLGLAHATVEISKVLKTSALTGLTGATNSKNNHGEVQKPLDLLSDKSVLEACRATTHVS